MVLTINLKILKFFKGVCKNLFNLKTIIKEASLPPKKKVSKLDDFIFKVSLGEEFHKKENGNIFSPCWITVSLIKFLDINLAKKADNK